MLYGEKVRLRAVERTDLPRYVKWFADPEVSHNMAVYYPLGLAQEEAWFETFQKLPVEERPLAIERKSGRQWEHIGGTGFVHIDWRCRSTELGLMIGEKSFWNRGYGSDALRALLRWGFETLNLNRIWLRVYEYNARAQRVYEKVGFVREGAFRQAQFREGRYYDVLIYSILRREWDARSGAGKER
jgi:RimJ/RimL family protein N-acetyltransferase